jgi:hypothetical protein
LVVSLRSAVGEVMASTLVASRIFLGEREADKIEAPGQVLHFRQVLIGLVTKTMFVAVLSKRINRSGESSLKLLFVSQGEANVKPKVDAHKLINSTEDSSVFFFFVVVLSPLMLATSLSN